VVGLGSVGQTDDCRTRNQRDQHEQLFHGKLLVSMSISSRGREPWFALFLVLPSMPDPIRNADAVRGCNSFRESNLDANTRVVSESPRMNADFGRFRRCFEPAKTGIQLTTAFGSVVTMGGLPLLAESSSAGALTNLN
jgi:hypothetical protein